MPDFSRYDSSTTDLCPRCGTKELRAWSELSAEEQEIALRLTGAEDHSLAGRKSGHLWCVRCFYEATDSEPRNA